MSLIEKMLKSGSIKAASVLSESKFFNVKDVTPTDLPILNIAFSGTLDGGLLPGLTVVAGESKSFKTMLSLYCMKAFLDKNDDGVALLYDSEFGITPEYLDGFGIDTERVLHIPITDVEQLKFDILHKLQAVDEKKEKVFIMIDSIGNLASKKEVDDAENEKSVADMSRAKSLKSLFRIITPYLTTKSIPCLAINHVYKEISLFPKNIIGGGTGIYYSSNQIFIISRSQEKDGTDLAGFKFTINIEKSRYVKEKSKLPFTVMMNSGIRKWSGLFDLALESGHITSTKKGWYQTVDMTTGEVSEKGVRARELENNNEFFTKLTADPTFKDFITKKFKLTVATMNGENENTDDNDYDVDYDE